MLFELGRDADEQILGDRVRGGRRLDVLTEAADGRIQATRDQVDHLTVGEVMQSDVVTTTSDASVLDAAEAMVRADVRHLPVKIGDRVEGMLSARDVLAALTEPAPRAT